jgi:GR25 family glycosyltransferase involved in LPS biosynthesis
MKDIAYLILAHTDPEQLARLTRALDYKSRIFIHLDAKSNINEFRNQDFPENVSFLEDRVPVSWAAYSQVEATLRMMTAALDSGNKFSHLVLLSGLDYPIKPLEQVHAYLNANPKYEFIRFVDVTSSDHYRVFFEHYWFLKANLWLPTKLDRYLRHGFGRALRQIVKKPQPTGIKICWGSAYWALTPACANYILDYTARHPDFVKWAKSSFAVDEHYFHTIIGNSKFLHHSDGFFPYQGNKTYSMANLHLIHESMRKEYSHSDFDELVCSDKFFVRKVMSVPSRELLNRLDCEVLAIDKQFFESKAKIESDHR